MKAVGGPKEEIVQKAKSLTFGLFTNTSSNPTKYAAFAASRYLHFLHKMAQSLKEEKGFCQLFDYGKIYKGQSPLQRF